MSENMHLQKPPDAEQQGLQQLCKLILGRIPPDEIEAHAWATIVELASRHDLSAMLAWSLNRSGFRLPSLPHQPLMTIARTQAVQHLALQHAHLQITQALNAAGIPHIWLKGIVLAATIYPDDTLRPMVDLDVLVKFAARFDVLSILQELGYRLHKADTLFDTNRLAVEDRIHHFLLRGGPANNIYIELHFRLLGNRNMRLIPPELVDWFWQQTTTYHAQSASFVTFTPEAHLIYLSAHAILQHGVHDFVLLRYLDLHLLIETQEIDWNAVVHKAVEIGWTYVLERALLLTCEYFDTRLPDQLLEDLRRLRPATEDVQYVDAMALSSVNFEHMVRTLRDLSWQQRVPYIGRIIFPDAAYLRRHYAVPEGDPVWPYYFRRWSQQMRKLITALAFRASARRKPRP